MQFGPTFRAASDHLGSRRPIERARPGIARSSKPRVESLDARLLMTVAIPAPDVTMLSAATVDSQSVTISYDVKTAQATPITLGFYRSADASFSPTDDVPVESVVALPSVDSTGASLGTVGLHTVQIPIPGGLPLNPSHPYVLAVANPTAASAVDPSATASFRTYTIGVVTHGGIQSNAWKKNGVPWVNGMAHSLLQEGYDAVIPYNWVAASNTAGAAAKQGPKLAKKVQELSAKFPAGAPVDIHLIGHSEGAVVNTQAIVALAKDPTPQLAAGYWQDTLLDPHAANPDFTGKQYDTAGLFGGFAKYAIDDFQADARDPLAYIPERVNAAQVFYQQTPAYHDHGANAGIYNLWGQVPVRGDAVYYNLTPAGIIHSGKNSVYSWYQNFVVPTLGDGGTGINNAAITGTLTTTPSIPVTTTPAAHTPVAPTVDATNPTYAGTAQPGSPVLVRVSHTNRDDLRTVARTTADANGHWSATIGDVPGGSYRVVAVSKVTGSYAGKRAVMGVVPLGPLVVNRTYRG